MHDNGTFLYIFYNLTLLKRFGAHNKRKFLRVRLYKTPCKCYAASNSVFISTTVTHDGI